MEREGGKAEGREVVSELSVKFNENCEKTGIVNDVKVSFWG